MNTVLTLNKNNKSLNFTHRSGDFKIVVQSNDNPSIISRLSEEEVLGLKFKNDIENTLTTTMQHSEVVTHTIFNNDNKTLKLIYGNKEEVFDFSNQEWEAVTDYMYNGVEGKVLA